MKLGLVEFYLLHHQALIFILTPDRSNPVVLSVDLSADRLRSLGDRVVADFSPGNINPAHPEWSTNLDYFQETGAHLASVLRDHLDHVDMVCFVPHSHLFHLPLHALRLESGKYLIEEKPVIYAPSATLLQHARSQRQSDPPQTFLGLGVGRDSDPASRRQSFEEEVSDLADLRYWKESRSLLGSDASKSSFSQLCSAFDVVHFSCHGHFEPIDPLSSGLLLGNHEGSEQSMLTAREIAGLDLDVQLVYLSACVSGRHDIQPGDEIMGLTRSLIRASASSVVVSLWPVAASGSTRQLVHRFYEHWLGDGLTKAEALRAAQLEVMQSFPHPYHWAPFVLFGDWA
jgi:CHAT domain-containing protein